VCLGTQAVFRAESRKELEEWASEVRKAASFGQEPSLENTHSWYLKHGKGRFCNICGKVSAPPPIQPYPRAPRCCPTCHLMRDSYVDRTHHRPAVPLYTGVLAGEAVARVRGVWLSGASKVCDPVPNCGRVQVDDAAVAAS
jgi:hypothetical protein